MDHHPRLNTPQRPIVNKYREGKVKSTPVRGVKEDLKPSAYKQWKPSTQLKAFGLAFARVWMLGALS